MAGRAGIVGEIPDHEHRHRDASRARGRRRPANGRSSTGAGRRRPRGGEAREPDRPVVDDFGIAQVAPARAALVGVDRGIEEARIGHRAVGDEAPLEVGTAGGGAQRLTGLHPGGHAAVALDLGRAGSTPRTQCVRRLVRVAGDGKIRSGSRSNGRGLSSRIKESIGWLLQRVHPRIRGRRAAGCRPRERARPRVKSGGSPAGVAVSVGSSASAW